MKRIIIHIYHVIWFLFSIATGMVGYNINISAGSNWPLFWSIMDFLFSLLAIAKWLIYSQLNLSGIKHTFAFFFN